MTTDQLTQPAPVAGALRIADCGSAATSCSCVHLHRNQRSQAGLRHGLPRTVPARPFPSGMPATFARSPVTRRAQPLASRLRGRAV